MDAAAAARAAVPGIPSDAEGPVFREPWEAQAFAMTLARYQHAWDHAADRTPHGEPIELQPQDFHDHD